MSWSAQLTSARSAPSGEFSSHCRDRAGRSRRGHRHGTHAATMGSGPRTMRGRCSRPLRMSSMSRWPSNQAVVSRDPGARSAPDATLSGCRTRRRSPARDSETCRDTPAAVHTPRPRAPRRAGWTAAALPGSEAARHRTRQHDGADRVRSRTMASWARRAPSGHAINVPGLVVAACDGGRSDRRRSPPCCRPVDRLPASRVRRGRRGVPRSMSFFVRVVAKVVGSVGTRYRTRGIASVPKTLRPVDHRSRHRDTGEVHSGRHPPSTGGSPRRHPGPHGGRHVAEHRSAPAARKISTARRTVFVLARSRVSGTTSQPHSRRTSCAHPPSIKQSPRTNRGGRDWAARCGATGTTTITTVARCATTALMPG